MTVRVFIIGSVGTAITALALWLLIIKYLDPSQARLAGFVLFFLSLFLAISSTAALVGYGIRRFAARQVLAAYAVRTSLRQGIVLGLFCNVLLLLQLINLYAWWLAGLALVLLVTIELIFLGYDASRKQRYHHARA